MARARLWTGGQADGNPFALPRGRVGRAAGWILAVSNRKQNAEVLAELACEPGQRVLEVGCGPGVLVGMLAAAPGVSTVVGVDPSAEMVAMAGRRNAAAVRAGRVRVRRGSAAATGAPDAAFDVAVSVNTVAMWPSLEDGVAELHRVVRPGGRALISWHIAPPRFALAPDEADQIVGALRRRFAAAERRELSRSVLFDAVK